MYGHLRVAVRQLSGQEVATVATTDQFVPINQAGKLFGISASTLRKRVSDRTLSTYRTDGDRRVTLVKVDDMAALFTPRPTVTTQEIDTLSAA